MRIIRAMVCGLVVLGASAPAHAEPITLLVRGTIDSFVRGGVLEEIPVGSGFEMVMTWDTDTPVSSTAPGSATYAGALSSATVVANSLTFWLSPRDGSSTLEVGNYRDFDSLTGSITDDTVGSSADGLLLWHTRWELLFPADTWDGTALPTTVPDTLQSGLAKLYIYSQEAGQDVAVHATITGANAVPEPGTLAVFGLGLLGAARLTRRRVLQASAA
jgi:hypothetical protein